MNSYKVVSMHSPSLIDRATHVDMDDNPWASEWHQRTIAAATTPADIFVGSLRGIRAEDFIVYHDAQEPDDLVAWMKYSRSAAVLHRNWLSNVAHGEIRFLSIADVAKSKGLTDEEIRKMDILDSSYFGLLRTAAIFQDLTASGALFFSLFNGTHISRRVSLLEQIFCPRDSEFPARLRMANELIHCAQRQGADVRPVTRLAANARGHDELQPVFQVALEQRPVLGAARPFAELRAVVASVMVRLGLVRLGAAEGSENKEARAPMDWLRKGGSFTQENWSMLYSSLPDFGHLYTQALFYYFKVSPETNVFPHFFRDKHFVASLRKMAPKHRMSDDTFSQLEKTMKKIVKADDWGLMAEALVEVLANLKARDVARLDKYVKPDQRSVFFQYDFSPDDLSSIKRALDIDPSRRHIQETHFTVKGQKRCTMHLGQMAGELYYSEKFLREQEKFREG